MEWIVCSRTAVQLYCHNLKRNFHHSVDRLRERNGDRSFLKTEWLVVQMFFFESCWGCFKIHSWKIRHCVLQSARSSWRENPQSSHEGKSTLLESQTCMFFENTSPKKGLLKAAATVKELMVVHVTKRWKHESQAEKKGISYSDKICRFYSMVYSERNCLIAKKNF